MKKQVQKDHYDFEKYCYPDRWASYYHQIKEILLSKPKKILEIGAGDETVKRYVTKMIDCDYKTLDIAEDLGPDIVASITSIPAEDNGFDTVCAFEVLEHLPWKDVPEALLEIARVAKHKVLISVPHFGPPIRFSLKLPFLPNLSFLIKIPYPMAHVWNGQHYWELGKRSYSTRVFRSLLHKHFKLERDFIPWDNPYHHFFILEKK